MEKDLFDSFNSSMKKIHQIQDTLEFNQDTITREFDNLVNIMKSVKENNYFSPNEQFSEINTENLRFLLVPFYQAELLFLLRDNRDKNLKIVLQFYDEYYKILKNYSFLTKEDREKYEAIYAEIIAAEGKGKENSDNFDKLNKKEVKKQTNLANFDKLSQSRDEKIQEFKYKKALIERIKLAEKRNEDESRDYWVDYINLNWKKMLENMRSMIMEFESLAFINSMKTAGKYEDFRVPNKEKKKIETVKITPDNMKSLNPNEKLFNNVMFGNSNCNDCTNVNDVIGNRVNYKEMIFRNPNAPTMTLDEYADKQIVLMEEQKQMEEQSKAMRANEDDLSDADEEVDNRRKQEKRAWDDWKDLNEKGGGNKMGK